LLKEKLAIKVRKSDDELNINCCVSQKDIYQSFLFYEKSFIGLFNFKQEDLDNAQLLQIGQTCDVIISFIEDSKRFYVQDAINRISNLHIYNILMYYNTKIKNNVFLFSLRK